MPNQSSRRSIDSSDRAMATRRHNCRSAWPRRRGIVQSVLVDRERLQAAAARAGIPRSAFHLPNQDDRVRIVDDDIYVLEIVEGGWAVYYLERGRRLSEEVFDTEDEACSELLMRLMSSNRISST